MENASKALIMAAGILIGVAILSLAVYLFVSFGSASAKIHEQNDANRINEFILNLHLMLEKKILPYMML